MLGGRRLISGDVPSQIRARAPIRARALGSSLGRRSVGARPSKASPSQVRVRVRVKVRARARARARVRVRVRVRVRIRGRGRVRVRREEGAPAALDAPPG